MIQGGHACAGRRTAGCQYVPTAIDTGRGQAPHARPDRSGSGPFRLCPLIPSHVCGGDSISATFEPVANRISLTPPYTTVKGRARHRRDGRAGPLPGTGRRFGKAILPPWRIFSGLRGRRPGAPANRSGRPRAILMQGHAAGVPRPMPGRRSRAVDRSRSPNRQNGPLRSCGDPQGDSGHFGDFLQRCGWIYGLAFIRSSIRIGCMPGERHEA